MTTTCAIRFDKINDTTLDVISEFLNINSTRYFLYEEIGQETKKVHFQGVVDLDLSEKSIDSWRKNIKDKVKAGYKNAQSLTIMKDPIYKVYCTKDKKNVSVKGYTIEELKQLEIQSFPKPEKKERKKDKTTFHKLYEYIPKEAYKDGPWKVGEYIFRWYSEQFKLEPTDFQVKCYVKSLIRQNVHETKPKEVQDRFYRVRAQEVIGSEFRYDFLNDASSSSSGDLR